MFNWWRSCALINDNIFCFPVVDTGAACLRLKLLYWWKIYGAYIYDVEGIKRCFARLFFFECLNALFECLKIHPLVISRRRWVDEVDAPWSVISKQPLRSQQVASSLPLVLIQMQACILNSTSGLDRAPAYSYSARCCGSCQSAVI